MKKQLLIAILLSCCCACGPKRLKCYGKRCVILQEKSYSQPAQPNS